MAAATATAAALDVIKEGDHVIFDEHGEKKSIHVIVSSGRAKVGKFHIPVGQLVGAPWGSTYKLAVDGSRLIPVTEHEPSMGPTVEEVEKDNATLVDLNQQNQKLKADDIAAMAASGKDGKDIVAALCSNSATFESKTEFAQEKYKKRKARKYMTQLTLRKPTSWGMCEVMFDKAPTGIWNLRPDSLSLLLSLGNVAAGSRVLLLENCQGLLVAACAERLGGYGVLCCVGTGGKQPALSGLRQLNLGEAERAAVSLTQLTDLQQAAKRLQAPKQQQPAHQQPANGSSQQQETSRLEAAADQAAPIAVDEQPADPAAAPAPAAAPEAAATAVTEVHESEIDALYDSIEDVTDDARAAATAAIEPSEQQPKKKQKRKSSAGNQQEQEQQEQEQQEQEQQQQPEPDQEGAAQQQQQEPSGGAGNGSSKRGYTASPEQLEQLLQQGFNSCIIAAPRLQPTSILQDVLPLLAPSAPFVIFSPWMQPLAEAMVQLQASKAAVLLQLQESWLRPFQVLPGRTHPHMAMTTGGTGGYMLSGITVAAPAVGVAEQGGSASEGGSGGRGGGQRGRGKRGRGRQ